MTTPNFRTLNLAVRIKAIALPEEDGGFTVIVPALPGCATQGDDIDDARRNAIEVIELWLDHTHDQNRDQAIRDTLEDHEAPGGIPRSDGTSDRVPLKDEHEPLKAALREAICSKSRVTQRCIESDPAGNTYAIDWTHQVRAWAQLCDLDLDTLDPSWYVR